jgi:hypothetical protein
MRMSFPNLKTGVGHWPTRTSSDAAVRPMTIYAPALARGREKTGLGGSGGFVAMTPLSFLRQMVHNT